MTNEVWFVVAVIEFVVILTFAFSAYVGDPPPVIVDGIPRSNLMD